MSQINMALLQGSLSRPDLLREITYMERLLYKNKQQHRAAHHYQRLQEVHKYLQLWKQLQVPELLGELAAGLKTTAQPRKGAAALRSGAQGLLALQRIVAGCQVAEALQAALHRAAAALCAQLALGYFVPLCLTAVAILARVRALAAHWVVDAVPAYNTLVEYVQTLPMELPEHGCGTLPQMLKCEWRGGLPHALQIPYAPGDGFEARIHQHTAQRQSQAQQAGPAAVMRSFLPQDDAELGERIERRPVQMRTEPGRPSAAATVLSTLKVLEDRMLDGEFSMRSAAPVYALSAGLQSHARPPSALQPEQPAPVLQSAGGAAGLPAAHAAFQLLWPLADFQQSSAADVRASSPSIGEAVFGEVDIIRSVEELDVVPGPNEMNCADEQVEPTAEVGKEGEAGESTSTAGATDRQLPPARLAGAGAEQLPEQMEQDATVSSAQPAAAGPEQLQGIAVEPAGSGAMQQEDVAAAPAELSLQAAHAAEQRPPLYTALPQPLSSTPAAAAEAPAPFFSRLRIMQQPEAAISAVPGLQPEHVGMPGEAHTEATGPVSTSAAAEERPVLRLPGSKSEQKRARQAEAAARQLEQQQHRQVLPQKRGWEEWLQGAAEAGMGPTTGVGPIMHAQQGGRVHEAAGRARPRGRSRGFRGGAARGRRGRGRPGW